jgi:glycyl-tRNA synthetase
LQYFDQEKNEGFVPYVVETSIGLDRTFLAVMSNAYREEKLEDGTERVVLSLPAILAPVKVAILPLIKKDGLPEKAREIMDVLKYRFRCFYEEKDTIGRRYRRMDAIGTPYCLTIDHQTLQDNSVTIRDRDTMLQDRIPVNEISQILESKLSL